MLSAKKNADSRKGLEMAQLDRIGISLETKLLEDFDKLIGDRGYPNRSEAVRDLIRRELAREKVRSDKAVAVAAVCIVYDHHSTKLMQKLTALQHSRLLETICSMHIHLDEHNCLEIIVLKGRVGQINTTAQNLTSQKGVKLGQISLIST